MDTNFRVIASKTYIDKPEWGSLVSYLEGNPILALAFRIFYLTNTNSTHSFDYFTPHKSKALHPQIIEYKNRARSMVLLLCNNLQPFPDLYYLAAVTIGPVNRNDLVSFDSKGD